MQALVVLLLLYLFVAIVILPIWTIVKINTQGDEAQALRRLIEQLRQEITSLQSALKHVSPESPATAKPGPAPTPPEPVASFTPSSAFAPPGHVPVPDPIAAAVPPPPVVAAPVPLPPMLPPLLAAVVAPPVAPVISPVVAETAAETEVREQRLFVGQLPAVEPAAGSTPTPLPPVIPPAAPPRPTPARSAPVINWEQFMGAKLFAWLGGLALFLGVAFFVKYSFEHNLIPPAVRVAIGFVFGAALVVGGLKIPREKYAITSSTLIAAGIVSLYAVTFACRSIYHFEFFDVIPTFLLMALITATAFILAVRLEAQVVAVLGILGGFLTPLLLSTGVDNPAGLFGYLALLDAGLIAVALHRRWFYLVPLGVAGTVLMMIGWADKFYAPEKTVTAMIVCLGFNALFIAATSMARRLDRRSPALSQSALALPVVAFGFAWFFLGYPTVAAQTGLFFGYVFLVTLGVLHLAWRERQGELVACAAGATTLLMIRWVAAVFSTSGAEMPVAMTVCLVFCGVYLAVYLAARRRQIATLPVFWSAVALPVVAFGFAWFFLGSDAATERTVLFFGFVFVLTLFLFVLAWCEGLGRLVPVAGGLTALLLIRWSAHTFKPEHAPLVMLVCLIFCAVYFAVYLLARRWERASDPVLGAAAGLPAVALAFGLFFMDQAAVAARPGLLFGFILAADLLLLALAWLDARVSRLHLAAGLAVFALLSIWTTRHLTDALLPWALALTLGFAVLHTVFPLLLERKRPAATPTWWSQLFPPLALLLMLLPIFKLPGVSLLLWPAILLVDVLAVILAVFTASLSAVAAVLLLTLFATGLCIFRVPADVAFSGSLLLVIGGFAVFFFAASLWLLRKLGRKLPSGNQAMAAVFGDARVQLPAFASLLPFLLLIMVCLRLAIPNPSAVFALGLLLVVLTLGLARLMLIEWLPACALAGVAALELTWHARHFDPAAPNLPLAWYAGFYAVFAVYPFLFRRVFTRLTGPWAVAALSGLAHFWMAYQAVKTGWPAAGGALGLVPAVFAVAPLLSLVVLLKIIPADTSARLNQLAWFGAVALFFITLVFPIQFDRQWLTVAWALEGAALLWLFHRVPHPGLRGVGVVLLVTAFVRLALNPAVLSYHVRGDTGIFNWYLYAYGLATVALFAGAALLAPPRHQVFGANLPPFLNTLGVILAFLLLNLEIADYFTAPGAAVLNFEFSANLPRDMTYTIGWAAFALVLLIAGIWRQTRTARYAAIALLSVALLKLFFHDLARLEALYRIGALFAVAVIAILASFAYQRFLPSNEKFPSPSP